MTPRDWSVYAVLVKGQPAPHSLRVRALEGVIAPGKLVELQRWNGTGTWQRARVVEPWEHGYGSIVCVEVVR